MEKLFLLDAYALIYRAYYAFIKNPRINSKGFNTSAILGFVNTLEDVLKKENPTHIGVAFDPKGPTFRHEAYEEYKAQREETPEVIETSQKISPTEDRRDQKESDQTEDSQMQGKEIVQIYPNVDDKTPKVYNSFD